MVVKSLNNHNFISIQAVINFIALSGLILGFTFFSQPFLDTNSHEFWRAFTGLVTFNTTHFFLTGLFFLLPEFRRVQIVKTRLFWVRATISMVFWFVYFFIAAHQFSTSDLYFKTLLLPRIVLTWHAIRQSLGLSLQETGYVKNKILTEHNFVHFLWGIGALSFIFSLFSKMNIQIVLTSVALLASAIFSFFTLRELGVRKGLNKIMFIPRYLFFCFYQINPFFLFFSMSLHGVEAVVNFMQMAKRSEAGIKMGWVGLSLLLLTTPIVAIIWHPYEIQRWSGVIISSFSLQLLFALSQTLGFVHCFAEEILFRFKDPDIRVNIGPLMRRQSLS